jgi:hypothetical protein
MNMPAPTLEYQSPIPKSGTDCHERYYRFVPIFAGAYTLLFIADVVFLVLIEPRGSRTFYYKILDRASGFPVVDLVLQRFGCFGLLFGGIRQAILWGFSGVGFWHLGSIVITKIRQVFARA